MYIENYHIVFESVWEALEYWISEVQKDEQVYKIGHDN